MVRCDANGKAREVAFVPSATDVAGREESAADSGGINSTAIFQSAQLSEWKFQQNNNSSAIKGISSLCVCSLRGLVPMRMVCKKSCDKITDCNARVSCNCVRRLSLHWC